MSYIDLLADIRCIDPKAPDEQKFLHHLKRVMPHGGGRWTPKMRIDLVCLLYGLDGMKSHRQQDVAAHFGVSQSAITQEKHKIIRELNETMQCIPFLARTL